MIALCWAASWPEVPCLSTQQTAQLFDNQTQLIYTKEAICIVSAVFCALWLVTALSGPGTLPGRFEDDFELGVKTQYVDERP